MNWFILWLQLSSNALSRFYHCSYGEFIGCIKARRIEELNQDPRNPQSLGFGL